MKNFQVKLITYGIKYTPNITSLFQGIYQLNDVYNVFLVVTHNIFLNTNSNDNRKLISLKGQFLKSSNVRRLPYDKECKIVLRKLI